MSRISLPVTAGYTYDTIFIYVPNRGTPKTGSGGVGGGGSAGLQPQFQIKKKKFCRHDYIERFTSFTLQQKSATEIV